MSVAALPHRFSDSKNASQRVSAWCVALPEKYFECHSLERVFCLSSYKGAATQET